MKILGSRQLPCRHNRMYLTDKDHDRIEQQGHSSRRCSFYACRQTFTFRLEPSEAQRITGDDVVRIVWSEAS